MFLDLSVPELVHLVHQPVEEITVVGDNNQRAVICLERLFEYIFGLYVHMIGRLVKRKQVVRFQHQFRHSQSGPFSSAEHGHLLVNVLAPEKELREYVPEPGPDIAHGHTLQGSEHGFIPVKDIFLILCEIAYVHVMTGLRRAFDRIQLSHYHAHKRCLALTVPAYERHLLASPDFHSSMREHCLSGICHRDVVCLEHHVTGSWSGRKLHRKCRIVSLIHLDALQFFQGLDPGLHLIGLGRLVPELRNEVLGLPYHLLLVLVCGHLLRHTLRPQVDIFGIWHLVVVDFAEHHLDGTGGDVVQEAAVVGNEHQGAPVVLQIILEPFYGFDVEVVGRLVEQQHIRGMEEYLGKFYPHVPALAEGLGRTVEVRVPEAEAEEGFLRPHSRRLGMLQRKTVADIVQPVDERKIIF